MNASSWDVLKINAYNAYHMIRSEYTKKMNEKLSNVVKGAMIDTRCFARSKFSRSLVYKKIFSLI